MPIVDKHNGKLLQYILPLDEAIASGVDIAIVSESDGRAETLLEGVKSLKKRFELVWTHRLARLDDRQSTIAHILLTPEAGEPKCPHL